eukprot:4627330-Prymnesium_polylepis.1
MSPEMPPPPILGAAVVSARAVRRAWACQGPRVPLCAERSHIVAAPRTSGSARRHGARAMSRACG